LELDQRGGFMIRLYIIDILMAGLLCGFFFFVNRPLAQHIWTLEEAAYCFDTSVMVMHSQFIRTVDINKKNESVKDSWMCIGNGLSLIIPCNAGSGPVGKSFVEGRRLQSIKNAVFWVY
jgi:hypothetical protein